MPSGVFKPYAGLGWTCGGLFLNTQYNYWIKASSGAVVKKDVKLLPGAAEAPADPSTEKEDTKKEDTEKKPMSASTAPKRLLSVMQA